jgi:thiol-disulfide isomerase/thioredoxin
MKNITLFISVLMVCMSSCKTSKPVTGITSPVVRQESPAPAQPEVDFSDPSTWILGYFDLDRLRQPPYSTWYTTGYNDYKYNPETVNKLEWIEKSGISIKIVMGIWCPDSRREVPRFMRVLNAGNFSTNKIELIGVDHEKNSPVENYGSLDIQRVPTFIIYKNNIETGRIIENPTTSLEQDILNILIGNE